MVLGVGLLLKRNYFISVLIFGLYYGYYQIAHPIVNGSDLVMSFFLLLGVICNAVPKIRSVWAGRLQIATVNAGVLIGQLQVAFMYLTSGWDKLISNDWRNGIAVSNLTHIDFYATNWVDQITNNLATPILVIVSWIVILFELLFPVLIWFPRFRYYLLATGVLFHLLIGFGLSLPDFAVVMIWTYILFIPDVGFDKLILNMKRIAQ